MFTFVETALFTSLITEYLTDEEYSELQYYLAEHPESGAVIPGSGGVRKLRWTHRGKGKRGDLTIIYYLRVRNGVIWMLTAYPKNVRENIPAKTLAAIRKEIENE